MNEFDQFVKHGLRERYYVRYADDFIFLSTDVEILAGLTPIMRKFLQQQLRLLLHPKKIILKSFSSGIDFLGWIHFPNHRVIRTNTQRRMFRMVKEHTTNETLQSYLGLLNHGNTHKLREYLLNLYGLFTAEAHDGTDGASINQDMVY